MCPHQNPYAEMASIDHSTGRSKKRRRFLLFGRRRDGAERGATAVEYGLMVGLIAVAIIGAVSFLSNSVRSTFNKTGNAMTSAAAASSGGGAPSPRQAWCSATYPGTTYYASGSSLPPGWFYSTAPGDGCFNPATGYPYAGP